MAIYCWAPVCKHNNRREPCKFFRFPTDKKELMKWLTLLRRKGQPGPGARVCSCHFRGGNKQNYPQIFTHETRNGNKKMVWSTEQISVLIEEHRKYPSLYTSTHSDYHNKEIRALNLSKIIEALKAVRPEVTESEVIHMWNSIRTTYAEARRKVLQSLQIGINQNNVHVPGLWYYKKLEFLNEHLKFSVNLQHPMQSILPQYVTVPEYQQTQELEQDRNAEILENGEVAHDPLSPGSNSLSETLSTTSITIKEESPPPPKKRKDKLFLLNSMAERMDKLEDSFAQFQTESCKDETDLFGNFVSLQLKKIADEDLRQDTIFEIHQILHRALKTTD